MPIRKFGRFEDGNGRNIRKGSFDLLPPDESHLNSRPNLMSVDEVHRMLIDDGFNAEYL